MLGLKSKNEIDVLKIFFSFFFICFLVSQVHSQSVPFPLDKKFSEGRWLESEFELNQFLTQYPIHPDRTNKLWELAVIYLYQSRYVEAEKLLLELDSLVTGEWKVKVEYWLGRSALDYDRLTDALPLFQKNVDSRSNSPEADHSWILLTYTLARLDQWKDAENIARKYLDRNPLSDYANYLSLVISESHFKQNKYETCTNEIELLLPLLDKDAYKERAYLLMAESYIQLKNWKDAVIFFGKVENEFPNSDQLDWVHFRLGFALMKDDQKIKAEEQINKISNTSILVPFKKALQIELWGSSGNLDKILQTELQSLTSFPALSAYSLNQRIWAASKLNQWETFKNDLLFMEKQPNNILPIDSLWAQLGQLSYQNQNYALSSESYQRAISFNKENNKNAWADLYFNAGLSFLKAGRYKQSNLFFDELISKFPDHTLSGDALMYLLFNLQKYGENSELLGKIKKYRDKYPQWYDVIDLLEAETLFQMGEEKSGLELLDKKIRYAQDDSFKTQSIYTAARLELIANRPDLALSNIRIMSRFYPQYFPEEIELMQIVGEFQIQSYAYLSDRIKEYRTRFGSSAEQWLIPMEIQLTGKRSELTPDNFVRSLLQLDTIESLSYCLTAGIPFFDSTQTQSIYQDQRLKNKLLSMGENGIFILNYVFGDLTTVGSTANLKKISQQFIQLAEIKNKKTRTDLSVQKITPIFQAITSPWVVNYILLELIKNRVDVIVSLFGSSILSNKEIDQIKYQLSWNEYSKLPEESIQFLLENGTKPTPNWLGLHYYGGISEYYEQKKDSSLSEFYRGLAMRTGSISMELYQLQLKSLLGSANEKDWDAVDEKIEQLLIPIQSTLQRMLDDMKLQQDFASETYDSFTIIADEYLEKYGIDVRRSEEILIMKIQLLLKEKRKKEAKKMVIDYLQKFPKSGAKGELQKLVK